MTENKNIEKLIAAEEEWQSRHNARLAEITALKEANEWDKLVELFAKEETGNPYPFTNSEKALMDMYKASKEIGDDALEFSGNYWNCTLKEIVEVMRKYGAHEFVITGDDSDLMNDIWTLSEAGCSFAELRKVTRKNAGAGVEKEVKGILVRV